MKIERLGPSQWQRLRAIRLRALEESPEWFAALYEKEWQRPDSEWQKEASTAHWRAISREGIDIALMGVAVAEPIRECDCWLFSCWIEPSYRGRGIMKLMIDELDVICHDQGWIIQGLGVWPHNIRAIKSYEKYGFEKAGEPKPSRSRPDQFFQPMFRRRPNSQ